MTRIFTDVITNMDVPDKVWKTLRNQLVNNASYEDCVRAALQAMCDCGMAVIEDREDWENSLQSIKRSTFLVIKLDAERKREEQKDDH